MKLRALAVCAALLLVTACGSDDGGGEPDPSPTTETTEESTEEAGLSDDDLEDALLTVDDVPTALGEDFEEVEVTESGLDSDAIVDGADECAEFIDDDYGPGDVAKAEAELESGDGEATVYSTVKAYKREASAERELESLRDVLSRCESMIVDLDGTEAVVEIQFTELNELDGYENFGDEGMAVAMQVKIDGELVLRDGYTLIRVDRVITFSGVSTVADLGDDVMLPLTESATELLEDLLADAS